MQHLAKAPRRGQKHFRVLKVYVVTPQINSSALNITSAVVQLNWLYLLHGDRVELWLDLVKSAFKKNHE